MHRIAACQAGSCPLWVKSRHWGRCDRCPLYPQKRTLHCTAANVRFVPKADILRCEKNRPICRQRLRSVDDRRRVTIIEAAGCGRISGDRRIVCSSPSAEIRFTRPLVPGVGRSGYAEMGGAQGGRPALTQICEIGFSRLDPVDQFRVAGVAAQHH